MTTQPLVDPFGRTLRDLRISVTDRCNLRCRYCMEPEGTQFLPQSELLSFDEIERVARVCVERFGFHSIRLTGGEPTVRAQLATLVGQLARLPVDLSLTTNGIALSRLAPALRAAGLHRVNISCDSLQRERFAELTGRDALEQVLNGIDAAIAAGFAPVKVNCVLMRGVNDGEVLDFAAFGRARGVTVRFIEFMPLDATGTWTAEQVVPSEEVVATIDSVHPIEPLPVEGSAPAARYRFRDGRGEVGVVSSVTRSFCGTCDRARLTAEGKFRNCLFSLTESDLRSILRGGGSDDELAEAIVAEIGVKWSGHSIGQVHFVRPERTMSQIGG